MHTIVQCTKQVLTTIILNGRVLIQPDNIIVNLRTCKTPKIQLLGKVTWMFQLCQDASSIYKFSCGLIFSTWIAWEGKPNELKTKMKGFGFTYISTTSCGIIRIICGNSADSSLLKQGSPKCLIFAHLIPSTWNYRLHIHRCTVSWTDWLIEPCLDDLMMVTTKGCPCKMLWWIQVLWSKYGRKVCH